MDKKQDLIDSIKLLVAEERSEPFANIKLDTILQNDLGMDGDDAAVSASAVVVFPCGHAVRWGLMQ